LSPIVSRTRCLRALLTERETIVTEREPEALLGVSEREPKMAAVCEPGRFRWRTTAASVRCADRRDRRASNGSLLRDCRKMTYQNALDFRWS
jgi:hypothetical protein